MRLELFFVALKLHSVSSFFLPTTFAALLAAPLMIMPASSVNAEETPSSSSNTECLPLNNNNDDDGNNGVYSALQVEYQDMAPWYDKFWAAYLDKTLQKPLTFLQACVHQKPSLTAVDIGCGTGVFLKRFMTGMSSSSSNTNSNNGDKRLPKFIGIEPSKAMLEQARTKFADEKSSSSSGGGGGGGGDIKSDIELKQGPAEQLPLANASVDVVCSTNAFHFFRHKETALSEMKRVLKRGGKLVITDWCNDYTLVKLYHNVIERLRWRNFQDGYPGPLNSQKMLELVQEAGFDEVSIERYSVRFWLFVYWGMHTITATKK